MSRLIIELDLSLFESPCRLMPGERRKIAHATPPEKPVQGVQDTVTVPIIYLVGAAAAAALFAPSSGQ